MTELWKTLGNDSLSFLENIVLWINLFGASLAFFVNLRASGHGIPRMRRVHFLVSGLAAIYALAYAYLLLFDPPYLVWSSPIRGVAVLAWFIVWVAPAWTSIKLWKELQNVVIQKASEDETNE